MPKFDSSRAWQEATGLVAANREPLLVLAGIFFLLPWLVFTLFMPEPPAVTPGMTPEALMPVMSAYLGRIAPWMIGLMLVQTAGMMVLLRLVAGRDRPTVGEAIRAGLVDVLPYVAAMLLVSLGLTLAIAGLGGAAMASGAKPLVALLQLLFYVALIYASVRLIVAAPVVAIEQLRNPLAVLHRAWLLTRGQAGRLFLFLLLLVVAGEVAIFAASAIVGSLVGWLGGAEPGRFAEGLVFAGMMALFVLYMSAVLAAIHRQLVAATPSAAGDVFS
jgi:hypothetical protein